MDPKQLAEVQIMKIIICTMEKPIYIITVLMKSGSLFDFLQGIFQYIFFNFCLLYIVYNT